MDSRPKVTFQCPPNSNDADCPSLASNTMMSTCDETIYGEVDVSQWQRTSDESFEALEAMCDKTASDPNSTLFQYLHTDNKAQVVNAVKNRSSGEKEQTLSSTCGDVACDNIIDESFEALEAMCDKTASDPNSTLFQYLHTEHKAQLVDAVKKRSAGENDKMPKQGRVYDEEALALQRLLNELRVEEQLEQNALAASVDDTLLDDVEAPSRFWDNTIVGGGEPTLQTSPVKMVGLLRPSTIVEDNEEDNDDVSLCTENSSLCSFQSALKGAPSEVSSSCYETAHESECTTLYAQNANLIDLDNSVMPAAAVVDLEKTYAPSTENSSQASILDETLAEITDVPLISCGEPAVKSESDDSIIEILSDEEDDQPPTNDSDNKISSGIKAETSSLRSSYSFDSRASSYSENKENCTNSNAADKSMEFNDTMEEVEYMMRKAQEYMAASSNQGGGGNMIHWPPKPHEEEQSQVTLKSTGNAKLLKVPSSSFAAKPSPNTNTTAAKPLMQKQGTFTLSPHKNERYNSPSPIMHKQKLLGLAGSSANAANTPTIHKKPIPTSASKDKNHQRYELDMRMGKLDIFKKPTKTGIPSLGITTGGKKQPFAHIVSPIGAYMKNTAKAPLISAHQLTGVNKDFGKSQAVRELEKESRLYQPKFNGIAMATGNTDAAASTTCNEYQGVKVNSPCRLPKKAYISSTTKRIVDQRTPFTIPGGNKIQKYLEFAMLPAVVRHEGKLKIPGGNKDDGSQSTGAASLHIPRRNDASLANLSVMSGDVSMYTIKDARKF